MRLSQFLIPLILLASPWAGAKPAAPPSSDVRILIDVSGSMKQNDPDNLRRPALRLLAGLLPQDTRAGVWAFSGSVRALAPLGRVDKRWKRRARRAASLIGSPGQRTDIAAALRRATRDWKKPAPDGQRHVVLLTDGMVDIGRDPARNDGSRLRILDQLLPRLAELGVRIHTIALSSNADRELLETLSRETGGWYEQVSDAQRLQRVFLRMFEKVGKVDSVPLKDNRFVIDRSIREATLLLFTRGGAPTRLVMPGGQSFDREHKPDNVAWHQDQGYELITITRPRAGQWKVKADVDPDNRVMVVTDLKMRTTDLPNTLVAGEQLPFVTEFLNRGRRITRKAFLAIIEADVIRSPLGVPGSPIPLADDGAGLDEKAGDGLFSVALRAIDEPGLLEVTTRARASTFRRERRQTVNVVPPASVSVTRQSGRARVDIALQPTLIDEKSLDIEAWLRVDGKKRPLETSLEDGHYRASPPTDEFRGEATLVVELRATSKRGNPVSWRDEKIRIQGSRPEAPRAPEPASPAVVPEGPHWGAILGYLGVANLLVLLAAGGIWWWLRRRRRKRAIRFDETPLEAA